MVVLQMETVTNVASPTRGEGKKLKSKDNRDQ